MIIKIPAKISPEKYLVNGLEFTNIEDAQKEEEKLNKESNIKKRISISQICDNLYLLNIPDQECLEYISITGKILAFLNKFLPDEEFISSIDANNKIAIGKNFILLRYQSTGFGCSKYIASVLDSTNPVINTLIDAEIQDLNDRIEELNLEKYRILNTKNSIISK